MHRTAVVLSILFLSLLSAARADEGMWTYNNFPKDRVRDRYGFAPDDRWLAQVRLASARLAGGCSGGFVSPDGLVLTNHHCAQDCLHGLSTGGKDYLKTGYYARTPAEELRCPEDEINQLLQITDVTPRMNRATQGLSGARYGQAERAEMARIEKECQVSSRLRCEVVRLYHGGVYNLYKYRRFQDVRLVFAPEFAIAFFGGDPDNFNFPRYDLDISFLRVYEDGKPARIDNYLPFSEQGAREDDLVFVSGHPGGTSRQLTVAQLIFQRDVTLPGKLLYLAELRGRLTEFQRRGPEQRRISNSMLFSVENGYKALRGRLNTLLDPAFFAAKVKEEEELRARIEKDPALQKQAGPAFGEIERAVAALHKLHKPLRFIEHGEGFRSQLFYIARTLLRGAVERQKANEVRLREFRDSALPELTQELFSRAPIYDEMEILKLSFALGKLREELGADHPFVRKVLGPQTPEELAQRVVTGSKLRDVALRRRLWDGGAAALQAQQDPMLALARLVDADARAVRQRYEDEIEAAEKRGSEIIAKARFAVHGQKTYPDATFTLRLSFGRVKGYEEGGRLIQPITHIAGLFDRATGKPPFDLPESWLAARSRLNGRTPLNFVTTNDIIGGNSGSPAVSRSGEIIGVVFDSNIYGLGGDYGYDEKLNRTVLVHTAAITEALEQVYGAERLLKEIRRRSRVGMR